MKNYLITYVIPSSVFPIPEHTIIIEAESEESAREAFRQQFHDYSIKCIVENEEQ